MMDWPQWNRLQRHRFDASQDSINLIEYSYRLESATKGQWRCADIQISHDFSLIPSRHKSNQLRNSSVYPTDDRHHAVAIVLFQKEPYGNSRRPNDAVCYFDNTLWRTAIVLLNS